ncbi:MAG: hypothetical protein R2828_24860 [Saprospiraceae bacterium]
MNNAKLIDILQKLSPKELAKLSLFIGSKFFNRNKKVKKLFKILKHKLINNQTITLSKNEISHQVDPKHIYDERRFNNLLSKLLHLVYDFLAYQYYAERSDWQQQAILEDLFERDAGRHVKGITHKWQLLQERQPFRDASHHLATATLQGALDRHELNSNNRRYHEHLQLQNDHLDVYYLIEKLRMACDMTSRNTVIQATYLCHFLEDIKVWVENHPGYLQHPAIKIYWLSLRMLEQQEEEDYHALKLALQEGHQVFPTYEIKTIYQYALNYSIKKINSGQSHFYREIFSLYQSMLAQELLLVSGQLSQWSFKNIITTAIRLKEYQWTKDFIEAFQLRLAPEEQFNAVTYNLGALYYAQGDYRNALRHLQNVEFTDTSYHLGAKIIQLKSYYELEEEEAFFSLIEAFRKYLRRNKEISAYRKAANAHFIQLAKELFVLKIKVKMRGKDALKYWRKLQKAMDETSPIANKDWLQGILSGFRKEVL